MDKKKAAPAGAGAGIVALLIWASQNVRCATPLDLGKPTARPAATSAPTAQPTPRVEVVTTTEVIIERPAGGGRSPAASARPVATESPGAKAPKETPPFEVPMERITMRTTTRTVVQQEPPRTLPLLREAEGHARLGVLAGTFPGFVALDVQLVRGTPLRTLSDWRVLPEAAGELEVSLDLEANLNQAGLAIATGDKVFAALGYQASWAPAGHGPFIGVGMRF